LHLGARQKDRVTRGIKKENGTTKRVKRTVTLDIACDLAVQAKASKLIDLRNQLAYAQMGQGFMRSQAAVCKTIEEWEVGDTLMVSDVHVDLERYCVMFGKKVDKPDHFNEMLDESGHDWVMVSGAKGTVLDIVPLAVAYCSKMNFGALNQKQKQVTPFYQTILFNQPTGKPLRYHELLLAFRNDLNRLPREKYPHLKSDEWGLHSWRRFAATVAKLRGLPNDVIQRLGRWRSDSFLLYFAFTEDDDLYFQSKILNGNPQLKKRTEAHRDHGGSTHDCGDGSPRNSARDNNEDRRHVLGLADENLSVAQSDGTEHGEEAVGVRVAPRCVEKTARSTRVGKASVTGSAKSGKCTPPKRPTPSTKRSKSRRAQRAKHRKAVGGGEVRVRGRQDAAPIGDRSVVGLDESSHPDATRHGGTVRRRSVRFAINA
jgi:hypothetical protein